MSLILGPDGRPSGPPSHLQQAVQWDEEISQEDKSFLQWVREHRKPTDMAKVDRAITFWKPFYFSVLAEDKRLLNGIEAYDLGDPQKTDKPNQVPYIAMCNLMALEGLRILGSEYPTTTIPHRMVFGSEREQKIADFWKSSFAPTVFQAEWAWNAILGIIAENHWAINDMLDNYQGQLP